ncbi:MAG TPA: PIN domain-containing protein [Candidatus Dormibacteraeota bacterium]
MTALLDTNILVRHFTGDPPELAARATRYLSESNDLQWPDLIVAETVYVLESFYEVERAQVAFMIRAALAFPAIEVVDEELLLRALEVYEVYRIDFAEAYLVASAERSDIRAIASFDRSIDRVKTVRRIEPPQIPRR